MIRFFCATLSREIRKKMTTTGLTHQIHLPPRLSNGDAVVKPEEEEEKNEGDKDASVQPLETPAAVSVKRASQPIFADEEEKIFQLSYALGRVTCCAVWLLLRAMCLERSFTRALILWHAVTPHLH